MKIIKQDGNVRLVKTIGNYMEYRYEIQKRYSYWKHNYDDSPTFDWAIRCYSIVCCLFIVLIGTSVIQ